MILVNQKKDLFVSIWDLEKLEVKREITDYVVFIDIDGYKCAKAKYGDWLFILNNKILARYKTDDEKEKIKDDLMKAIEYNRQMFEFPVCY